VTDARTGQILAAAFCEGKCAEFALFKRSRTALAALVVCLADSGYQGLDKRHAHSQTPQKKSKHRPLTDEDKARNRAISQQRIGGEIAIARLKVFKLLSERYRNRRKQFGLRFNLLCAICNLERTP